MARRRGRQKGHLRLQSSSWIGSWWEEVRLADGSLDWHRVSRAICRATERDDSGRARTITKKEAQRRFDEAILQKIEVRSLNPQSLATVKEFVERKYRPLLAFKRRKTQEHLRNMLDNHILPVLGKYQLRDVTSDHVQNLILSKIAEGKSPQTVWHIRATISALFKKAKGIKWFSGELPTEGIEMPALTHRERAALTKEQAILLLQRLPLRTRGMVLALALTGLRIGELLGLKWKRVNLTDKPIVCGPDLVEPWTAAIRETWVKVYGKHLSANTARGQYQDVKNVKNGRRDVPLLSLVVDALRKIHAESVFTGPDDPVFASSTGKPIDAHNELARHLKPAVAALRSEGESIPPISWHDLRHTASTLADQAGLSEAEKQRILGHSEKMTRHYTKAHLQHARVLMDHMQEGLEAAAMPRLRRVK